MRSSDVLCAIQYEVDGSGSTGDNTVTVAKSLKEKNRKGILAGHNRDVNYMLELYAISTFL